MLPFSQWRVLVVEDEQDNARVLHKILTYNRIQTDVAVTGEECLEKLPTFQPTVVLMDLRLPTLDGWQTLAEIRNNPSTAQIPVIAVTAYGSELVFQEAQQAGFRGYFSKPINALTFVQELNQMLYLS